MADKCPKCGAGQERSCWPNDDGSCAGADIVGCLSRQLSQRDARIAEMEAKLAWRPIETAPKDGTSVLLFADNWGEPVVGSFAYSHDENGDETEVRDWFSSFGDTLDEPEHWMPLPEPPKESSHD